MRRQRHGGSDWDRREGFDHTADQARWGVSMVMTGAKLVVVALAEIVMIDVIGVMLVRAVRNGDRQLHRMFVWRVGGVLDAIQHAGR